MTAPLRVLVIEDDFRVAGLHRDIVAERPGYLALGKPAPSPRLRRRCAPSIRICCSSTLFCPTETGSHFFAMSTSMHSCSRLPPTLARCAGRCGQARSAIWSSRSRGMRSPSCWIATCAFAIFSTTIARSLKKTSIEPSRSCEREATPLGLSFRDGAGAARGARRRRVVGIGDRRSRRLSRGPPPSGTSRRWPGAV